MYKKQKLCLTMFDKCVYLISGRCKYEKATDSDCPATVSGDTAPECTTLMRNNQVCEGDNPLPDGQKGSWIDSADNCGTNDDVYKCMRGELYCYNGFDIRCYLKKHLYAFSYDNTEYFCFSNLHHQQRLRSRKILRNFYGTMQVEGRRRR